MNKPQLFVGKIAASLFCLTLLIFTGSASADNTGSGGTITYTDSTGSNAVSTPPYIGGFVVHKFTASGTLTIPSNTNATILVVAGGGGGGSKYGDGGGAGGLIYTTNTLVGGSNYSVTIGTGGAGGGSGANANGTTGSNSIFSTLTALGGGGGGSGFSGNLAGLAGGSGGGGGGGGAPFTGGAGNQPGSASGGFGNAGTTGNGTVYGGGGGAGAAATSYSGGVGLQYNIIGVPTYYAGGGGGINGSGTGGLGGGGNPATSGNVGGAGTANTGGGGGGGFGNAGGAGGSGIVIIRYAYDPGAPTVAVTSPSVAVAGGGSISATATVTLNNGVPPYSVTYFYKLTNNPTYTATAAVGPFGATNTFSQTLGALANGVYQIYATVSDSAAGTATSVTNIFTVFVAGNTGLGGTISYTDTNGLNPVVGPPYVGGYVVQTFTASGTFILPSSLSADVLVVAGGGGAGGSFGCGGGAGGLVYSNLSLGAASYGVTVGAGGGGYTGSSTSGGNAGTNGANSVFSTLTALGGGGGGGGWQAGSSSGVSGGSGGGGHNGLGAGSASQPGGFATAGYGFTIDGYGGGGGAGAAATNSNGGIGRQYNISGATNYYAGGGGGLNNGAAAPGGTGLGASGGGGNGGASGIAGSAGAANTGGGGGGGYGQPGGSGGSGIVIVRYPFSANPPVSVLLTSPTNSQNIVAGNSISTTALVAGGATPFTVTYYYRLTSAGSYTATAAVGPFGSTNNFTQTLGTLAEGIYQIYSTVADSTAGSATSATNTFTVYPAGNTGAGGTVVYTDSNGLNPVAAPPYTNGYVVQTFSANGTLVLPSSVSANLLVVAGGGGGGGTYGGGGGAGGLIYTNLSLSGASYSVTVGSGGAGTSANTHGAIGTNSVFNTLTALGGGGGGIGYLGPVAPQAGGSGGGGGGVSSNNFSGGTGLQPGSASGGFGNNGGSGLDSSSFGGGGGAGAVGGTTNGGVGLAYAISGVTNYYAGGGGGIVSGTGGLGGGGNAGTGGTGPGGNGAANTGGGGGGGVGASGGKGGSGIVIVRYAYVAHPPLSVAVTSPNGQSFLYGTAIPATALIAGGSTPFSVTYYYKLTTAGSYTATAAVGPFGATNGFAQTLGILTVGTYQIYATATDNASSTATSATNTFTVSLTTGIAVQDANFETPGTTFPAPGWATVASIWNPGNASLYQQNSVSLSPVAGNAQFTNTCPGGVDWFALLSDTPSISQDLLTNINVGDTISVTFYGGRGQAASTTAAGGIFDATILVGSTPYGMTVDTTVLTNGTWQSYTLSRAVTNSGDLSLQFSTVSGNPWLDNISVTRTVPSVISASGALSAVSTTYGAASSPTSFSVSGTNITGGILVTAPTGFEVSQFSGSGYGSTTTVGSSGIIAATTVYVRLAATASVSGSYNSQNVVVSSVFAANVNVPTAASGNSVSKGTPIVQTATTASAISYGQTLASSTLTVGSFTNLSGTTVALASTTFVDPSIAPNAGSTNVLVNYVPTDTVDYNNVTNTVTVDVYPWGVSPLNYSFGLVATSTVAQATFTITNSGGTTLNGTASVGTAAYSIISGSPFSVAAGGTSAVTVQFAPMAFSNYSDTVQFTSGAQVINVSVSGTGMTPPAADFTGTPRVGLAPLPVTFTDTSIGGGITNRFWNFGDGSTTNTASGTVQHNYTATGRWTVTLIASNPLGASTNTKVAYIGTTPVVRILPLGDSITDGYPVTGGYRNLLAALMTSGNYNVVSTGLLNNNNPPGVVAMHEGHGGATIAGINYITPGVLANTEDPDIILLLIGTNDYGSGNGAGATNRLDALISNLATNRPNAKIIVANVLLRTDNGTFDSQINTTFNPFIPGIVAAHAVLGQQVFFNDLRSAVTQAGLSSDNLHPNAFGYACMATNWLNAITNVIGVYGTTNAPVISHAVSQGGLTNILVTFSKPVATSAANVANFTLSGGVTISAATLDAATERVVTLTTSPLTPNASYTLTASNVVDITDAQTPIAGGTITTFNASAVRGATNNVTEASHFQLAYSLDIPNTPNYSNGIAYTTDNHASLGAFGRVAYYLELQPTNGGPLQYMWASMNPFTTNIARLGVPTVASGAVFQQNVTNMNVASSVTGIVIGTNLTGGNLEFWPSDYNQANAAAVTNANGSVYDWGDQKAVTGTYGSMQIANANASQMLLSFNGWGGTTVTAADVGIGNNMVYQTGAAAAINVLTDIQLDWTFRTNAAGYAVKTLQVFIQPVPVPGTTNVVAVLGSSTTLATSNLVALAGNPANYPLSVTAVSATSTNGSTVSLSGGNITYTATTSGVDKFTYTLSDGNGGTVTGTVTVSMDHPPVAGLATYNRAQNVSLKISRTNLLAHVTDADGDSIALDGVGTDGLNLVSTNGVNLLMDVNYIYYTNSVTPNVNDSFGYAVDDGRGGTNTGTVDIIINNNLFGQTTPSLSTTNGTAALDFAGIPGFGYTVQVSTNLSIWADIYSTNLEGGGNGLFQYIDTNPPQPAAYYRLRYNP